MDRLQGAAALTWGDVQDASDGAGILVRVRRSKTDQDGTAADTRRHWRRLKSVTGDRFGLG